MKSGKSLTHGGAARPRSAVIGLAVLGLVFGVEAGRLAAVAGGGLAKNLRHDIFTNISCFSFEDMDRFENATLVTRITTDVNNVQMAFMMSLRVLSRSPIMIILALIMTLSINVRMALIILAVLPLQALFLIFMGRLTTPIFRAGFRKYDELNQVVEENIDGIRVVKAFVREAEEISKFQRVSLRIFEIFYRAERRIALIGPVLQFTVFAMITLVLYISGYAIVGGDMQVGELTGVVVYTIQILISTTMLSMVFMINMISSAGKRRVEEVLNAKASMRDPETGAIREVPDGRVEFRSVHFSYRAARRTEGEEVLADITFTLEAGKTLGILGATGSGKSSLVQLIPRLYDVSSGALLVGGHDVRHYECRALRDGVAMVLQKNQLFRGSIAENLRWGDPDASQSDSGRRTHCGHGPLGGPASDKPHLPGYLSLSEGDKHSRAA